MVAANRNKEWQALEQGDISLEKLARHFEAYNRSEGWSQDTVLWYARVLRYFGDYLKNRSVPDSLDHLDVEAVRGFILYLHTKKKGEGRPGRHGGGNLQAISVQTYVRALRGSFSWLHGEGYTAENRLAQLKPPKAPRRLAEVLKEWGGDPHPGLP